MAAQLDIFGGSTPLGGTRAPSGTDPALAARLGRKQENRDRLVGAGAGRERVLGNRAALYDPDLSPFDDLDPHTLSMESLGIRDVTKDVLHNRVQNKVPYGPHDASVFRKAGVVREVPLVGSDAATTMQSHVSPARVDEIVRDPQSGSDPRFRGTPAEELPLVVEQMTRHPETGAWGPSNVIYNGNHRAAALLAQGQMFMPAHVITREQRESASDVFRGDKKRFKAAREQRLDVGSTRMVMGDATITKGMGAGIWDEVDKQDAAAKEAFKASGR